MSKWLWLLSRILRRTWFRATLFSLLAAATALIAIVVEPYIPRDLPTKIGADAVDNILGIIASSMLAVTTFSLSTMVSAYSAATSNVTPRATTLIMEDSTTQNVLSTFLGSFLFSLVGIIALSTGAYGEAGRVVLFAVTILVILLVIGTLLRWIDHLSRLGRVTETTARVEAAAARAMRARHAQPHLGGQAWVEPPASARPVYSPRIGYIQHIDVAALSRLAEGDECRIILPLPPGSFVDPSRPIGWLDSGMADREAAVRDCFTIDETRSFDQDPRFGASVLAEIASRALSPAVNDPGTAIEVIGRAVRLLAIAAEPREDRQEPSHPRLFVAPIRLGDLFDDLFSPIARDGAGILEVGMRLQKAFLALAQFGPPEFAENAARHSQLALKRAEPMLRLDEDKAVLRGLAEDVVKAAFVQASIG